MFQSIRYVQYFMIFCILGVVLTQGFWLYKDYNYYSGQPLFSEDYSFFLRTANLDTNFAPVSAKNGITKMAPVVSGHSLPSIVAYPSNQTTIPIMTERIYPAVPSNAPSVMATSAYKPINYKAPLSYVLEKMKLQFGISILLILFTTTCFIFMSVTIFRQKKLSAAKNNFINNMTHELKTPLATVAVAVEAMRNFGAWDDQQKAQLYLQISKYEIDHLSSLIELILQQSIFESENMELTIAYHDVNAIVRKVVENYTLGDNELNINATYGRDIPLMPLDAIHISNVIRNLLDNAIKYSTRQPIITIDSKFQDQTWMLRVTDNGIGIPKIYHKEVFHRFFRVPKTGKEQVKGFGLGLSYIKEVLTLHQGKISLQSTEGTGSTFLFSIPLKS
jgi:nitrogen-specific signal transduction histidine kinase